MSNHPNHQPKSQTTPLTLSEATSPLPTARQDHFLRTRTGPLPGAAPRNAQAAVEEFEQDARKYIDWFEQCKANLSGRIRLLRYVNDVYRQPHEQWEACLGALRPDHATMAKAILHQMLICPELVKRIIIGISRYDEAAIGVQEIIGRLESISGLSPEEAFPLLAPQSIPRLKGKLYLLTVYDLLFKDDAVLNQIFPLQARKGGAIASTPSKSTTRPGHDEKPIGAPPKPVQTLPTPSPIDRLLQQQGEILEGFLQQQGEILGSLVKGVIHQHGDRLRGAVPEGIQQQGERFGEAMKGVLRRIKRAGAQD